MIVICEQGKVTDSATNTAGIYYWKNNLNGKGYVGQTLDFRRRVRHYIGGRFKNQHAFYAAVQKYGLENFTCYKLMDCCPSKVALNYWETYWVKELSTVAPNGYNLTSGGGQCTRSKETGKKIADALRGRKLSDECRKKLSDTMRGRKLPPRSTEWCMNISNVKRGIPRSEKVRANVRRGVLLSKGTLWKEFFVFN